MLERNWTLDGARLGYYKGRGNSGRLIYQRLEEIFQLSTILPMTANIVLPTLTNWAETHLTNIFTATAQSDFDAAFDAFISQNVHITLNGKALTRAQYKAQLQAGKFEESGAQVLFLGAVEVPKDTTQGEKVRIISLRPIRDGVNSNLRVPSRLEPSVFSSKLLSMRSFWYLEHPRPDQ